MSKYKITCNNPEFVGKRYHGLNFVAIAETEDDVIAREFQNRTLTTNGVPMFIVETVDD